MENTRLSTKMPWFHCFLHFSLYLLAPVNLNDEVSDVDDEDDDNDYLPSDVDEADGEDNCVIPVKSNNLLLISPFSFYQTFQVVSFFFSHLLNINDLYMKYL